MRLRKIALGCTLAGALGCLVLPPANALAANTAAAAASKMPAKAALTITAPRVVIYGANVRLSGRLTFRVGTPHAGAAITITRTGSGTAAKSFTVHTGKAGRFALTDHDPAKAHYKYTARFAGSAAGAKAKTAVGVTVAAIKPKLTVSAPAPVSHYGGRVKFTVTLGPTFTDRRVTFFATPRGGARKMVATGKVTAKGKWYAVYTLTRTTTFTASFGGDSHNSAATASTTVQAQAKVAERLGGFFKTAKAGRITYDVFHGRGTLTLYSTVRPAKHGECLEPETQQLDGRTWDADTKYGCDKLTAASHDTAPFTVNQAVGDRYRIRGDFIRGAKDRANLSQRGPWLYFEVVK